MFFVVFFRLCQPKLISVSCYCKKVQMFRVSTRCKAGKLEEVAVRVTLSAFV